MPPSRRKSSNRTLTGNSQPTLTFNSRSARVTKPILEPASKSSKKVAKASPIVSDEQTETPSPAEELEEPAEEEVALAVRPKEEDTEPAAEATEAEQKARKITEVQIKKYWSAKEVERIAPRGRSLQKADSPQNIPLTNIDHPSAPTRSNSPRQSPPPLRSLLPIRSLHRHRAAQTLAARCRARAEPTTRSARRVDERRSQRGGESAVGLYG